MGGRHQPTGLPRHRGRDRRARRWVVSTLVVAIMVMGGGVAFAAWSSSGSGAASSKATSALPPTTTAVSASAFTSGLLYPGGTGDARITVNNPNPYPVKVTSVVSSGAPTGSGGSGTCSTTGVTVSTSTSNVSSSVIAANGSTTLTLPGAASMSNSSETGCQGATFSVPVTVTIESAA